MRRNHSRRSRLLASAGLVAVACLLAAACGSSSKSSSSTTTAGASAAGSTATTTAGAAGGTVPSGTLNGSGSTFQANFTEDAAQAFEQMHSGTTINYAGGGSGKGQSDLQHNLVALRRHGLGGQGPGLRSRGPSCTSRSWPGPSPCPTTCRVSQAAR